MIPRQLCEGQTEDKSGLAFILRCTLDIGQGLKSWITPFVSWTHHHVPGQLIIPTGSSSRVLDMPSVQLTHSQSSLPNEVRAWLDILDGLSTLKSRSLASPWFGSLQRRTPWTRTSRPCITHVTFWNSDSFFYLLSLSFVVMWFPSSYVFPFSPVCVLILNGHSTLLVRYQQLFPYGYKA